MKNSFNLIEQLNGRKYLNPNLFRDWMHPMISILIFVNSGGKESSLNWFASRLWRNYNFFQKENLFRTSRPNLIKKKKLKFLFLSQLFPCISCIRSLGHVVEKRKLREFFSVFVFLESLHVSLPPFSFLANIVINFFLSSIQKW